MIMTRIIWIIPLCLLSACGEEQADPDLSQEQRIEADARSLDEAADEAARIVEEDAAAEIDAHAAEAAALYAAQQSGGESGRVAAEE